MSGRSTTAPAATVPPTQHVLGQTTLKPLKHMRFIQHNVSYHKIMYITCEPGRIALHCHWLGVRSGAGSVSLFNMADAGGAGD